MRMMLGPGPAHRASTRLFGGGRDLALLWAGEAVSNLGSAAALIGYPLLTLRLTGSASAVGLVMAVAMLSQLLAGLPGGLLVDRFDRRRLMLSCDAIRLAGQGGLVAGLTSRHADLFMILAVSAVDNAVGAVFGSAQIVAVRHVAPPDQLPIAIARVQARDAGAMLAGPPLGGLLFAVAPWLPFAFNCASYLASFGCITLIRAPMRPPPRAVSASGANRGRFHEVLAGLRWLWQMPFLRVTLLLIAGTNLASNSLILIAIVAARQRGDPSAATGLLLTLASAGSLIGALIAPSVVRRISIRAILIINRCVWVTLIPLLLLAHNVYAVGVLIGTMFLLGPSGSTAVITRRMALTPDELQGRASSATGFCAGIAAPIGTVAIGFTLGRFGLAAAVLSLAAWMAVLAVITIVSRGLRSDREPETAGRPGGGSSDDSRSIATSNSCREL
jgi:predicted MFS family arabinose efflux permease